MLFRSQMSAVDPEKRLGRMVGRLSMADMQDVEKALRLVLEL